MPTIWALALVARLPMSAGSCSLGVVGWVLNAEDALLPRSSLGRSAYCCYVRLKEVDISFATCIKYVSTLPMITLSVFQQMWEPSYQPSESVSFQSRPTSVSGSSNAAHWAR